MGWFDAWRQGRDLSPEERAHMDRELDRLLADAVQVAEQTGRRVAEIAPTLPDQPDEKWGRLWADLHNDPDFLD